MWYTLVHCDCNGGCTGDGFIKRSTVVVNSWHLPLAAPIKSLMHNQHCVYIMGCYNLTSERCHGSGGKSPTSHCGDLGLVQCGLWLKSCTGIAFSPRASVFPYHCHSAYSSYPVTHLSLIVCNLNNWQCH
jgi:hypothetical protein